MDIQSRKIEFMQEFLKIQSEEVISKLENILRKGKSNAENIDFNPMSIEEFNLRIDKSMNDSENGKLIEASELKAKMEEEDRIREENRRIKEWEDKFDQEQKKKEEELIKKFYNDQSSDQNNENPNETSEQSETIENKEEKNN